MTVPTREVLNRLLDSCIKPNGREISEIVHDGRGVAAVFFELSERGQAKARLAFGWDGESVLRLPDTISQEMALGCDMQGDSITSRWLKSDRVGRILAVIHDGATLLINYVPGQGFSLEPGSEGWVS